jgi:hypothetical protein
MEEQLQPSISWTSVKIGPPSVGGRIDTIEEEEEAPVVFPTSRGGDMSRDSAEPDNDAHAPAVPSGRIRCRFDGGCCWPFVSWFHEDDILLQSDLSSYCMLLSVDQYYY